MVLLNFKFHVLLPVIIIILSVCLHENNALKKTMKKINLTINKFWKDITSCCRNQDQPLLKADAEQDLITAVDTVFAAMGYVNILENERMKIIIKENIKDIEIMCSEDNDCDESEAVKAALDRIMTKVWQAETEEQKKEIMRRNSIKKVDSKKETDQVLYKFEIDASDPNRTLSILPYCAETHNITVGDYNSLSNFSLPDQISPNVKCTLACMLAHTKLVDLKTGRFGSASKILLVKILIKSMHSSIKTFYPEFAVVNSGAFFDTIFEVVDICKSIDLKKDLDKCEVAYKYTLCAMQQEEHFNQLKTEWLKARNEKKRRRQEWEKKNKEEREFEKAKEDADSVMQK